ncbi:hypothetical protein KQX54_000807 [Cotesia glomerata]|uniref:Uncharacterized protein n=1 Tax=Cotesia glomerata TaxID=32391 RepID=A0AAV7IEX9_COTGL|nr:hypothetical protein KQX54_000807 [Cotesia glomerata]
MIFLFHRFLHPSESKALILDHHTGGLCFIHSRIPNAPPWHFYICALDELESSGLESSSSWPNGSTIPTINDNLEERPIKVMTTKLIPMSIEEFLRRTTPKSFDQLNRIYHDLTRLLRITALCRRFGLRLRKKAANLKTEPITVQELNDAKIYWVKITQQHAFNQEIKQLSRGEHLSNSNPLVR